MVARARAIGYVGASLLALGCARATGRTEDQAVGTYVGGGSFLFGRDECTYEGSPGVFDHEGREAGPRFVLAAGTFAVHCPKVELAGRAFEPTGLRIAGPSSVTVSGKQLRIYSASLVADDRALSGRAALVWTLGPDCDGVATFAPVLGAQDTGGPERIRTLLPTAPGACTVAARASTGSDVLYPSFHGKAFDASMRVTIRP